MLFSDAKFSHVTLREVDSLALRRVLADIAGDVGDLERHAKGKGGFSAVVGENKNA